MSEETTFVGQNIIDGPEHVFTSEEIDYLEAQGCTIAEIRAVVGKIPAGADKQTLDAAIGEAKMPKDGVEPNTIDPTDPANEGKEEGKTVVDSATE